MFYIYVGERFVAAKNILILKKNSTRNQETDNIIDENTKSNL